MPKIYIFNNGGEPGWYRAMALAESGHIISGHICSHECFMADDMGITSDWHHDDYKAHYPEGYELEWVPTDHLKTHPGFVAAVEKNKALDEKDAKPKNQPSVKIGIETDGKYSEHEMVA